MSKLEKRIVALSAVVSLFYCMMPNAGAMHIMEGYLPAKYCIAWTAVCIPFLAAGIIQIRKIASQKRKALLLLAMSGAYCFVLSALKIPSVTGSSSHPTGTGLGTILFGPAPVSVIGVIVLLFQAILLAHGGLTTLGANAFSMAIAGPFLTYGIYKVCKALGVKNLIAVFLAASLGDFFTYCITSFQLALAHPGQISTLGSSMIKFMAVFAATQIPLAVIEGMLTVAVMIGLEAWAKPELREIGYIKEGNAA